MEQECGEKAAQLITSLMVELASELDLHYEDEDFFALTPTVEVMRGAAEWLSSRGFGVPEAYTHVLRRYNRHRQ